MLARPRASQRRYGAINQVLMWRITRGDASDVSRGAKHLIDTSVILGKHWNGQFYVKVMIAGVTTELTYSEATALWGGLEVARLNIKRELEDKTREERHIAFYGTREGQPA